MAMSKIIAGGMLRSNTPIEDHREQYGLWVKREDKSCPWPGPPFSKTRGCYYHIESRPETLIGALDTYHSQAGHAVARACQILGKQCIVFYPEYKYEPGHRAPQDRAKELGAELYGLKAGRSSVIYHQARRVTEERGGYMMPNALKLEESVAETAKEVTDEGYDTVIIPASSGTIAAGVIAGFAASEDYDLPRFVLHQGYSRPAEPMLKYLSTKSGVDGVEEYVTLVDEGYNYKDKARPGETPPWACNEYYDLKAFRWWLANRDDYPGETLFWNIG